MLESELKRATITIIIPNRNHGKYIRECIDSIINQSDPPNQIIIVDDASDDDSVNIIKSLVIPNLKFIQLEKNVGAAEAINKAIKYATSEYLMFCSSNDMLDPNLLKNFQKDLVQLKARPGIWSSCFELFNPITKRSSRAKTPLLSFKPVYIDQEAVLSKFHSVGNWVAGSTALYRADLVRETGGLDSYIGGLADYLLIQICAFQGGAIFSPYVLSRVLIHTGYLNNTYKEENIEKLFAKSIDDYQVKYKKLFTNNYVNLLNQIITKNKLRLNNSIHFLFYFKNFKFILNNIYYRYIKLVIYKILWKNNERL